MIAERRLTLEMPLAQLSISPYNMLLVIGTALQHNWWDKGNLALIGIKRNG
jgi:hypothetical protein